MKLVDIDLIMKKINWNNQKEEQEEGIKLAKQVKNLNAFLQPPGKEFWENCAKILYERNDAELTFYLPQILKWLQDMNWPGAVIKANRLKKFKDKEILSRYIKESISEAELLKDEMWIQFLNTYQNYCDE